MTIVLVPQLDGGPLATKNCNCACGAMAVAFETANLKRPTASQFRANVRNPSGTPDRTGGTNPSQIVETARRAYSVTLDQRVIPFEDAWAMGQSANVALGMSISYQPVATTSFNGSPGFFGNHQVVLHAGKVYDPLADGRRAGIPDGPQRWPKTLLRNAAGRLNVSAIGTPYRSLGQGQALVVIARSPATKPKRFSVAFAPGAIHVYTNGDPWTRAVRSFSKNTTAPCTAPITIPWRPGYRKRLVMLTAGTLMGHYVDPGAAHVRLIEHKP